MKKALPILLLLAFLCTTAAAQAVKPSQVPAAVKQTFQNRFPAVKSPGWKIKSDKNFEAEFTLNGAEIAAKFDPVGKWLETESAIPKSQVPKPVMDAVAKRFAGYKVIETQSVQPWNSPDLIYEIHAENAKEIAKAQFTAGGAILNHSAKPKPAPAGKK